MSDQKNIPTHIAIIMDGNRRWATKKGLPAIEGHREGTNNLERVVEAAIDLGVKTMTVYALSTENLRERSAMEVGGLFKLLFESYNTKMRRLMDNGIKINIIGQQKGLPKKVLTLLQGLSMTNPKNPKFTLNIAFNYGGKAEIIDAFKKIIEKDIDPKKITSQLVEKHLYTAGQEDPQLMVRTGGNIRLSNYLLWQSAYSELYFTPKLWPEFDKKQLKKAIDWYVGQKRNFGK